MNELAVMNTVSNEERRHLIFGIGKELYAIHVTSVSNIIVTPAITRVPNAPAFYSGIINLRGEIIPVMNMRRRLGKMDDSNAQNSRIIILNLEDGKHLGIIVDEVNEVISFSDEELESPTPFMGDKDSIVRAIGKKNDELISIIEIDSILEQKKAS